MLNFVFLCMESGVLLVVYIVWDIFCKLGFIVIGNFLYRVFDISVIVVLVFIRNFVFFFCIWIFIYSLYFLIDELRLIDIFGFFVVFLLFCVLFFWFLLRLLCCFCFLCSLG